MYVYVGLAAEITTESGELVFGSSVTLRCSGDSGATIQWTGPDLSGTGITVGEQETSGTTPSRTLTFDAVLESHAGDYTCTETGSDSDSFTIPGSCMWRKMYVDVGRVSSRNT